MKPSQNLRIVSHLSEFSDVLAECCESILLDIHWMFGGALSPASKEFRGEFPTRLILKFITFVYFLGPHIFFHKMAVHNKPILY